MFSNTLGEEYNLLILCTLQGNRTVMRMTVTMGRGHANEYFVFIVQTSVTWRNASTSRGCCRHCSMEMCANSS